MFSVIVLSSSQEKIDSGRGREGFPLLLENNKNAVGR